MTGKSALLDIVEFALGRRTYNVPVGPISERVAWFGVLLQFEDRRVWVARPAPVAGQASSQEAMLETGTRLKVPLAANLVVNSNVKAVRTLLDRALSMPRYTVPGNFGSYGNDYAASIPHALLFCFQKQFEIASQEHLFHRQTDPQIAEAIRSTLPFFLGAVPLDYAVKTGELADARKAARRISAEIKMEEEREEEFDLELSTIFEEALLLGLEAPGSPPSRDAMLRALRSFREGSSEEARSQRDVTQVERRDLRTRRAELQRVLSRLDDEAFALHQYLDAEAGLEDVVKEQVRRLEAAEIFQGSTVSDRCPVCNNRLEEERESVSSLLALRQGLLADLPVLEAASERNRNDEFELNESIRLARAQLASLDEAERSLSADQNGRGRVDRGFALGRLSARIDRLQDGARVDLAALRSRLESVGSIAERLESEVGAEAIAERLTSRMNYLSELMRRYRDDLQLEHQGALRLDMRRLTVVVDSSSGPVSLRRVGSGGNWIGYHILTHLALHAAFAEDVRPVPRFLFLDQPSQAYFPADSDLEEQSTADQDAVRRLFKVLYDFTSSVGSGFQVIVCDHADLSPSWFQDSVVERWRDGTKLVPEDWPNREIEGLE
ncbi:DUF3732 domain-containing protein [Curtobacterium flaccumfaciens]|uniref:DUF3732 domain-containing protein n=1 Tax=Curtobacterium flaccumfaciens TaxID=2035 RepID=UPI0021C746D1|nr:DUF3732 domain-containing protein [Curtobacterium flaccumfaciens]UXN20421.1 DUF3732 domain-containing protein [Curtobacterium flaccumfaciens pv. flaccumfaciens]